MLHHGEVLSVCTCCCFLHYDYFRSSFISNFPLHILFLLWRFAQPLVHNSLNFRFLWKPKPVPVTPPDFMSSNYHNHPSLGTWGWGMKKMDKFHNLLQGFWHVVLIALPIHKFQSAGLHPQNITFLWHKQVQLKR